MNKFDSLKPEELIAIATTLAVQLMQGKTALELRVLANIAIAVADLLSIASSQMLNVEGIANLTNPNPNKDKNRPI